MATREFAWVNIVNGGLFDLDQLPMHVSGAFMHITGASALESSRVPVCGARSAGDHSQ
jgi:hypothetical protein